MAEKSAAEALQEILDQARREGFNTAVFHINEQYVLLDKQQFVKWVKDLGLHVESIKTLCCNITDEEDVPMVDDLGEEEPLSPPPSPVPKKKGAKVAPPPLSQKKQTGGKKPVPPKPAKPGIRVTPEQAAALDQQAEQLGKKGNPVNW